MVDLHKYKKMFIDGAVDCITQAHDALAISEQNKDDQEAIQVLFRAFHSIKGMSATMNYLDIMDLSHKLEDLLDGIRGGKIEFTPERLDILFEGTDVIENMVHILEIDSNEEVDSKSLLDRLISASVCLPSGTETDTSYPAEKKQNTCVLSQTVLSELSKDGKPKYEICITISEDSISPPARAYIILAALKEKTMVLKTIPAMCEIENGNMDREFKVYIGTELTRDVIESIINSSVEIEKYSISEIEVASSERAEDPQKLLARSPSSLNKGKTFQYRKPGSVKVETHVLDALIDIVSEIFIKKNQLKDIAESLNLDETTESVSQLEKLVQKLYNESMTLRLVPISLLTDMIPRILHELLHKSDKKVEVVIIGNDITLDRSIVEKLGDPVIHLIRNCIDHGLETPQERIQAGKPESGKLTFKATREKDFICIELSDDGRGLNSNYLIEKIIDKGLAAREDIEKADLTEIYNYIWLPGFSTADQITSVSGRGVGMDIVKSVVEGLGGRVSLESTPEQGTTFRLQIPMTIAIIKTFRIKLDNDIYAVPLGKVVRAVKAPLNELKTDEDGMHFYFRDEKIPVYDLKKMLQYSTSGLNGKKDISILILDVNGQDKTGLIVDSFLASYDTVVKSLGIPLERLNVFNGATVSEKGELILILDVNKLFQLKDAYY